MPIKDDVISNIILILTVPESAFSSYCSVKLQSIIPFIRFKSQKTSLDQYERRTINQLQNKNNKTNDIDYRIINQLIHKQQIILSKKNKTRFEHVFKELSDLEEGKVSPSFVIFCLNQQNIKYVKKNISHYLKNIRYLIHTSKTKSNKHNRYNLKKDKNAFIEVYRRLEQSSKLMDFASSYYYNSINMEPDTVIKGLIDSRKQKANEDDKIETESFLSFKLKQRDLNDYIDSVSARKFFAAGIPNADKITEIIKKNNIQISDFLLFVEKISYLHDSMEGKVKFNPDLFERNVKDLLK